MTDAQVCFNNYLIIIRIQSINIVESPQLKLILLLFCQELKESDIPGHMLSLETILLRLHFCFLLLTNSDDELYLYILLFTFFK